MTNRWIALTLGDWKQMKRDPMLIAGIFAPILITLFIRFIIPMVSKLMIDLFNFDLMNYYDLIVSFFSLLIPSLIGMLAGFLMLDERDEQLIAYFAVTPISKKGYMIYRLAVPSIISFLFSLLFLSLVNYEPMEWAWKVPITLLLGLEAPFYALCLVAFSSNKIEGLALSKVLGIFLFAPFVVYFVSAQWQWLAGILPSFWASKLFLSTGSAFTYLLRLFLIGILIHMALILLLLRKFLNKIE